MSPSDDETGGFLGRWAKRKQAVQLETQQVKSPAPLPTEEDKQSLAPTAPAETAASSESHEKTELPLPSLDDVLPGGDVSMFLAKHVPDSLRNLALRKAWASDPEISTFIEIAENQWDFNNPDSIPGFSSKLEGIDIKAMVEKMFNNVAPVEEMTAELKPEALESNELEAQETPTEISENIIMDTKSKENIENPSKIARDEKDQPTDVAPQQNAAESMFYDIPKKRHGSALPS
jgi:hypothetical protein